METDVMTAVKICLLTWGIGAIIAMLVAALISVIYRVIGGNKKSAAKGA